MIDEPIEEINVRTEDYHYYSGLCRKLSIVFIVVGVLLPILTAYEVRYVLNLFPPEWKFPYLGLGIGLVITGIALLIFSSILSREYEIKTEEKSREKGEKAEEEFQKRDFKFCMHCGEKISKDAMFCSKCGKKQE